MVTAAVAAPALTSLPDGEPSDDESGKRVEPPEPKARVAEEADKHGTGEVCAGMFCVPSAGGRGRVEPRAELQLRATKQRQQDQAAHREADPEIARLDLGANQLARHGERRHSSGTPISRPRRRGATRREPLSICEAHDPRRRDLSRRPDPSRSGRPEPRRRRLWPQPVRRCSPQAR
jgi:hypothetical protein